MTNPCRPCWLPHFLASVVIVPIGAVIVLVLYSVYTDEGWSEPGSGFAWLGVFMFLPVLVIVAALECRALLRRDAEAFKVVAGLCALVAVGMTVSLGEAAAVWLGLQEGKLPLRGLVFVGGVWVYSILVCLGHWHLYCVFRPAKS
jgi:hypothetical protein